MSAPAWLPLLLLSAMGLRPRPVAGMAAALSQLHTLNGFLCLYKPAGLPSRSLSNILLTLLRRACKVGHVGTLDPAAAGVVVVALGRAVKLIPFLSGAKSYEAVIKLGLATSSDDCTGRVSIAQPAGALDRVRVVDALHKNFSGSFTQVPPDVSAVSRDGVRSYKRMLTRASMPETAELEPIALLPKRVTVHSLRFNGWCNNNDDTTSTSGFTRMNKSTWIKHDNTQAAARNSTLVVSQHSDSDNNNTRRERVPDYSGVQQVPIRLETLSSSVASSGVANGDAADSSSTDNSVGCPYPEVHVSLTCGSGFYVRSLARDLGRVLGVPSTLAALERTRANGFSVTDAIPLYDLTRNTVLTPPALRPSDAPFLHFPPVVLHPIENVALPSDGINRSDAGSEFSNMSAKLPRLPSGLHAAMQSEADRLRNEASVSPTETLMVDVTIAPFSDGTSINRPPLPLMSAEQLHRSLFMWNCDTQVIYSGVMGPAARQDVSSADCYTDAAAPLSTDVHMSNSVGSPSAAAPPYLVRVYALCRRPHAEALLKGCVMDVACPWAKQLQQRMISNSSSCTIASAAERVASAAEDEVAWPLRPDQPFSSPLPLPLPLPAAASSAGADDHDGDGAGHVVPLFCGLAMVLPRSVTAQAMRQQQREGSKPAVEGAVELNAQHAQQRIYEPSGVADDNNVAADADAGGRVHLMRVVTMLV